MRVFLDQDVPHNICRHLKPRGHAFVTAFQQGWSELENGDLLRVIQKAGFEVLSLPTAKPNSYAFIEMALLPKRPYVRWD